MILADSSIIIYRLRRRDPKFHALFHSLTIEVCGLVRAEVLTGARTPVERQRILNVLNPLRSHRISDGDWDSIGDLRASLEVQGYSLSLADVAIGGVAILNNLELWSRDKAHMLMASLIPSLRLFAEPP